jgi:hypothetical protein
VIEDIDLVVGHRHQGGGQALVEFLLALARASRRAAPAGQYL